MRGASDAALRCAAAGRTVDVPVAVVTWSPRSSVGQIARRRSSSPRRGAEDADDVADPDRCSPRVAATWVAYLVGMWVGVAAVGHRATSSTTTGSASAPIDLIGVPIGVLSQLVAGPARLPAAARAIWPDTFTDDRL